MGATGDKVKARYSYNYVKEDGVWKIQHHHSSVMPEEIAMGKSITEDEVRSLFGLWNGALATLDPKKVASRYAKNGVLLPTVSDTPRTDFTSIEDYFVNFLKNKREFYAQRRDLQSTSPCYMLSLLTSPVLNACIVLATHQPKARSSKATSLSVKTRALMLASTNSLWVPPALRLRADTPSFTFGRTESGRSITITRRSCRRAPCLR